MQKSVFSSLNNAVSPVLRIAEMFPIGPAIRVSSKVSVCIQFLFSIHQNSCFPFNINFYRNLTTQFLNRQTVAEVLGVFEFLPSIDFFKMIGQQFCRENSPIIAVCESVLFLITGFNEKNLNAVRVFPFSLFYE